MLQYKSSMEFESRELRSMARGLVGRKHNQYLEGSSHRTVVKVRRFVMKLVSRGIRITYHPVTSGVEDLPAGVVGIARVGSWSAYSTFLFCRGSKGCCGQSESGNDELHI